MNSYRISHCFELVRRGFGLRGASGISAGTAALAMVFALTCVPTETRAQDDRPWRRDGEISIRSIYDDNVFRLTDGQKNNLGSGSSRYTDMTSASDYVVQVGVGGELRHGPGSSRVRIGGGAIVDAYASNTSRTHVVLDAYISRALGSSRNVLAVKFEVAPSEFRRTYLSGGDASSLPVYAPGLSNSFGGEVEYRHRLIGGSGPDLDIEIGVRGTTRSIDQFDWRDRSMLGGRILFDLKVNSDVDVSIGISRSRASYTEAAQPVLDLGVVTMVMSDKDFNDTRLSGELRFDLGSDARLTLEYQRRIRDYLAVLGVDPVYGDRQDTRNVFGAEIRYDISSRVDARVGGRYQEQVTFRPAKGSTGDAVDFERMGLMFQLRYTR